MVIRTLALEQALRPSMIYVTHWLISIKGLILIREDRHIKNLQVVISTLFTRNRTIDNIRVLGNERQRYGWHRVSISLDITPCRTSMHRAASSLIHEDTIRDNIVTNSCMRYRLNTVRRLTLIRVIGPKEQLTARVLPFGEDAVPRDSSLEKQKERPSTLDQDPVQRHSFVRTLVRTQDVTLLISRTRPTLIRLKCLKKVY